MKIRKLDAKDAPFMLEWMHDLNVTSNLMKNFNNMTLEDCEKFIENSQLQKNNIHLAIVDDNDEYLGTVSLKNIHHGYAEFAIVVRRNAMGTGVATEGMRQIIEYGFNTIKLKEIYWCVYPENKRAMRFYEKNKYEKFTITDDEKIYFDEGEYPLSTCLKMIWFKVKRI